MRTFAGSMPSPSAAFVMPASPSTVHRTSAMLRSMRLPFEVTIAVSRMGRHPIRHRFGFFLAEIRVCPEKREEREVDDQPEPAECIFYGGHVGVRAEPLGNLLRSHARADRAEHD